MDYRVELQYNGEEMAIQVDEETYYEIVNGKFIQGTSQKSFLIR